MTALKHLSLGWFLIWLCGCSEQSAWTSAHEETIATMTDLGASFGAFLFHLEQGRTGEHSNPLDGRRLETETGIDCSTLGLERVPHGFLEGLLVPDFANELELADGWDQDLRVLNQGMRFAIQSAGPDGVFEDSAELPCGTFVDPTQAGSADDLVIVWIDGVFVRWYENRVVG